MVVGNDQKVTWNDAGKPVLGEPGHDSISIVEIGQDPDAPEITVSLPLANSIFGPPTNVGVTPDGKLALVANSVRWERAGEAWKSVPNNELYVIDLEADPPAQLATVEVGDQPSGLAISRAGDLALVANRASNSITVLAIDGKEVKPVGSVDMGESVAAVAIAPDGRRALAAKFPAHKIALLDIDGQEVTYKGQDLPVGLWPYNVAITPDGKLALTADNGASGASDGNVDTVSVIDLEADPPRVIDRVVVGDGPEGLAISPKGDLAVAVLLKGSAAVPAGAWFANPRGSIVALAIDGKTVTRLGEVDVGRLPEGAVFSPDGQHLYVGNFPDATISILKIGPDGLTDTGKTVELPGRPASMGGPAH
jgi:DNA-binding beta-propeller fold protein YncE